VPTPVAHTPRSRLTFASALGPLQAAKHAFAARAWLGDPGPPGQGQDGFAQVEEVVKDMLSSRYAEEISRLIADEGILPLGGYGGRWNATAAGLPPVDHGTSHLCVVDAQGGAVSLTTTINTGFGSKVLSRATGILLNNQMDDFSTPGRPNAYGLAPAPANYVRPGKRPLSSMSPIIVEQEGRLRAVVGASGGPRIVTAVLQALVRVLAYGETPFAAVAGPRLHHQLAPQTLFFEDWAAGDAEFRFNAGTLAALKQRGHTVQQATNWGAVTQAVVLGMEDGQDGELPEMQAVSDPRKDGAPAGY
jgi:gamma-glutamyltranspeptidase / glutathione hydrolase / leukotriene-C4 hydrolase